ncbi:MAG: PocR ligand-binding domain-containing protein [Phycisphaerae bacterium]|nr:PocR ligand-binding domain-containing protein [Phycisphaerae bacterium]
MKLNQLFNKAISSSDRDWSKVGAAFQDATRLPTAIWDVKKGKWNDLKVSPERCTSFCAFVRDKALALCVACDRLNAEIIEVTGSPRLYLCHSYLVDFGFPLKKSNEIEAVIFGGQIRTDCFDDAELENLISKLNLTPKDAQHLVSLMAKVPRLDDSLRQRLSSFFEEIVPGQPEDIKYFRECLDHSRQYDAWFSNQLGNQARRIVEWCGTNFKCFLAGAVVLRSREEQASFLFPWFKDPTLRQCYPRQLYLGSAVNLWDQMKQPNILDVDMSETESPLRDFVMLAPPSQMGSVLVAPLRHSGVEAIGGLVMVAKPEESFDQGERQRLQRVLPLIEQLLENVWTEEHQRSSYKALAGFFWEVTHALAGENIDQQRMLNLAKGVLETLHQPAVIYISQPDRARTDDRVNMPDQSLLPVASIYQRLRELGESSLYIANWSRQSVALTAENPCSFDSVYASRIRSPGLEDIGVVIAAAQEYNGIPPTRRITVDFLATMIAHVLDAIERQESVSRFKAAAIVGEMAGALMHDMRHVASKTGLLIRDITEFRIIQ